MKSHNNIFNQRQRLSAAKFRKKSGAALSLNWLMCGKCAADLVNSVARVRLIFVKCAAKFLNYVGFLFWKAAQIFLYEVRLIIISIRTNE